MLDAILRKFEGNKTFTWRQMHEKDWHNQFHSDFFVVENMIKYLVADSALQRIEQPGGWGDYYKLSDRGFAMLGDVVNDSYLARYNERVKQERYSSNAMKYAKWAMWASIIGVAASIIIAVLQS